MRNTLSFGAAIALLGFAGLGGCKPNNRTDTPAERAGRDTVYAGDQAAKNTAHKSNDAFGNLKKDTKEALAVLKVKNAFIADNRIDAKNINVDGKDMTIHLYGTVSSAKEKQLAEQVAKKIAGPEFKVMSHLQAGNAHKKGAN